MITQQELDTAKLNLEKLGFAPLAAIGKGLASAATAIGKGIGTGAKFTKGEMILGGTGMGRLGGILTGLGGLGMLAATVPYGSDVLKKVPVVGPTANFLNPYSRVKPYQEMAERYSALDPKLQSRIDKGESMSKFLARTQKKNLSYNMNKTGSDMFSSNDYKRYRKIKSRLEKTASVVNLKRAIQSSSPGNKDFARNALAYMAGATALGVGAPLISNMIGEGMNFARRGRLNRDFDAMIKADPELRSEPQTKPIFEILHRSSPYIAQEPVIAATVVRNMVDAGQLDIKKFKDILDVERARQDTKHPLMRDASRSSHIMKMPPYEM